MWALTGTSLRDKLSEEVEALAVAADESAGGAFKEDPYFLGLVSGALYNVGQTERAGKVAERLLRSQVSASDAVAVVCPRFVRLRRRGAPQHCHHRGVHGCAHSWHNPGQ